MMSKDMNDIVGKKLGKLTVLEVAEKVNNNQYYKCKCDCGEETKKLRRDLVSGTRLACQKCLAKEQALSAVSDIIGKKFSKLTVLSIEGKHDNGAYYYNCKCDCGNEEIVIKERRSLLKGKEKDLMCPSCKTKNIAEDIVGKEFSNLKILYFDHTNKYGAIYYKCLCKLCNKTFDAERQAIKNGKTKQCQECTKKLKYDNFQEKLNEPIGKKFGKLTVLSLNKEKSTNKHYFYNCKCDCGNDAIIERLRLINGEVVRCNECYWKERLQGQIDECLGKKFGKLTVVSFAGLKDTNKEGEHLIMYNCKCDCGGTKVVSKKDLKSGAVKSCGCLYEKNLDKLHNETNVKHGMSDSHFYQCYYDMMDRCYNPNNARYHRYGGRGIKVCDEWLGENGFINFKNDMGKSYNEHNANNNNDTQLNRIDNNLDYSKHNCVWSTNLENSNNQEKSYQYFYCGYWYTAAQIQYFLAPYYSMQEVLDIINYYGLKNGDIIQNINIFAPRTDTCPIKFIK